MIWFRIFAILLAAHSAQAAFIPKEKGLDLDNWKHEIEDGRAASAEKALYTALKEAPTNPHILNLLGFANRKMKRWNISRQYYVRALKIDPAHRGALEYMGELELQLSNITAARNLLKRLRLACPSGCEELQDLENTFIQNGLVVSTGGS